ncbi:MAG: lysophospholipid acyltransferase family protein [Leptospirales bacterium]
MSQTYSKHARWSDRLFSIAVAPAAGLIGFLFLFLLRGTLRFRLVGFEDFFMRTRKGEPVVVALWHNQILLMPFLWRGRRQKGYAIVSRSKDGEMIAALLRFFRIGSVRGSSTRGGTGAMKRLIDLSRDKKNSFFVTPDGPLGPAFLAKEGVAFLCSDPEVPLYCFSVSFSRFKTLGSWDGFLVPYPLSRAYFISSPPLYPGRELDVGKRAGQIQNALNRANELSRALSLGKLKEEEARRRLTGMAEGS